MKPPRRRLFCCYCKRGPLEKKTSRSKLALTSDHINPRALGGGRKVPCCRYCNGLKGALHPKEWFWFIDHHPAYWKTFRTNAEVARLVAAERVRRAYAGEKPLSKHLMGHAQAPVPTNGQYNA